MKLRKKSNIGEESYWKSFTDIMAGLLLVILLVLMLLLLLMSQMEDKKNDDMHQFDMTEAYTYNEHKGDEDHRADHDYDHQYDDSGGGGDGGGDTGANNNPGQYDEQGHDKTAVFVTVVDKETGNVIKTSGTLFELYAERNAKGGLQTLHTYYPEKIEYKEYQTTEAGTFYLPEKIKYGWYSLHNLKPPKGYGLADDVSFNIDKSLDWPEPFMVEVPMEPAKGIIYIQNSDADTKTNVGGGTYEVYAAEDIITLDGTVRYRSGEKVDEFVCDENGSGNSIKLYLGKYSVKQIVAPEYYALAASPIIAEVDDLEGETKTHTISCEKTRITITLTDELTKEPVADAVYTVSGKDETFKTSSAGVITIDTLDKNTTYAVTLDKLPEPYRIKEPQQTFKIDASGRIDGKAEYKLAQTAYVIRLTADVTDIIFRNSVSGSDILLYDANGVVAAEWEANGNEHLIEGLEPGLYTLEVDGRKDTRSQVNLKDSGAAQSVVIRIWTIWDTISVVGAAVILGLIVFVIVRIVQRRKKKKANG